MNYELIQLQYPHILERVCGHVGPVLNHSPDMRIYMHEERS